MRQGKEDIMIDLILSVYSLLASPDELSSSGEDALPSQ